VFTLDFFAWFVYYFTRSVNLWPPILITIFYTIALVINFFSPGSILFSEVEKLSSFSLPSGNILYFVNSPANPFRLLGDIAWIAFLIYTGVACISFAKRGNTAKAIIFGTTIFVCLGLGYLQGTMLLVRQIE